MASDDVIREAFVTDARGKEAGDTQPANITDAVCRISDALLGYRLNDVGETENFADAVGRLAAAAAAGADSLAAGFGPTEKTVGGFFTSSLGAGAQGVCDLAAAAERIADALNTADPCADAIEKVAAALNTDVHANAINALADAVHYGCDSIASSLESLANAVR